MLEWIISSAVLTAVVIVLRLLLKGKMSLRLQYALWAVVLLRLLLPVSFGSTAVSVQNFVERPAAETPKASNTFEYGMQNDIQIDIQIEPFIDEETKSQLTYPGTTDPQALDRIHKYMEEAASRFSTEVSAEAQPLTLNEILNIVWACGAGAIALWLLITNLHFYRKLRRSRERLEVEGAPLPVFVTDRIDTPCLFGLIRPKIYVTPEVAQDAAVLRYSIEHEATHRRHGDHIWSLLRGLCLAVHWFNPLVWIAAVLSRNDAELACDEATIKRIGEEHRADYGYTLLQLTCEKRPAIFVAATTMTGSGRSIKERIKLIVKKPKTAIITLIAIVLIVAIAVGCTFTGAKTDEETTDPTESGETTPSAGELDVSGIPALLDAIDLHEATISYHAGADAKEITYPAAAAIYAERYMEELKLLPLQECKVSSSKSADERWGYFQLIAPHIAVTFYGYDSCIHIETDNAEAWLYYPSIQATADTYETFDYFYFEFLRGWLADSCAATLYGANGRLLTAEELDCFIDFTNAYTIEESRDADDIKVVTIRNLEIGCFFTSTYSDVRDMEAQAFLECLCAVDSGSEDGDTFEIEKDGRTQLAHCVSRARANEVLMKYAGVTVEEMHTNWFEEVTYDPAADCFYPLINVSDSRLWSFRPSVGVENGDVVTLWNGPSWAYVISLGRNDLDSFTPDHRMTLEKNGDSWRILSYMTEGEERAQSPATTEPDEPPAELTADMESLCGSGDASLTLFLADIGEWGTYTGDAYTDSSLRQYIRNYNWTRADAPSTAPSDYWLTAVSADGTKRMTFWDDGGAGTVEYSDGSSSSFWKASRVYPGGMSVAEYVRSQFDRLETDFSRVSFRIDGTAEDAAEYFATTAVGEHMRSLEPGNGFGADDYQVVTWEVRSVSEDGRMVKGSFTCAVVPWHPTSTEIRAGNTREGTGQYAGKSVFDRTFVLELQDDGNWHCVEIGTG